MADLEYVNPGTPVAGPYTPGVKANGFLFVSGQGPGRGTAGDIKEQTRTTLENVKAIIDAAGSNFSKIVNTTVFLKDMKDFGKMNRAYTKFFEEHGTPGKFPARACVEVSAFPVQGMLIEIKAIVAL
jgi:2-iminobutanoate/2-iminopropanoate deaminase